MRLVLDDGHRLLFTDQRRFGTGIVIDGRERSTATSTRGSAPSRSTRRSRPTSCSAAARGPHGAPVKAFLLDQRRVAGIGNIYADEALFRARIHPLKPAGRLRRAELERLHAGIVETLEAGIAHQGASIDDYRDSNGERGSMQDEFLDPPARGAAVPALRRDRHEARRRRPRHLRLPQLPAVRAPRRGAAGA